MIDWKDGAVCFGNSRQWPVECIDLFGAIGGVGTFGDFQLNEMREGDYIEASELDTEQKYNDAVEVFRLFGFGRLYKYDEISGFDGVFAVCANGVYPYRKSNKDCKRKITYPQLMAIGKLKRAMVERDEVERVMSKCTCKQCMRGLENYCMAELKTPPLDVSGFNTVEQSREKCDKRNKSKQAYDILKALDYEYDLVKQRWYKKAYV